MLNYEFPPLGGGAANANYHLLREFADRADLAVDLVTSSPERYREEKFADNSLVYRLNVNKSGVHYWTQREILRYSWKAYRKSRELHRDYDLVHAWFGIPSGMIARLLGVPYIVALRGSDVPGYNERFTWQYALLRPIIRKVWRDAEAVIANSEDLRELALETADIPIEVIPNGVDVDAFEPTYHDRDSLHLLCVARLIERKGIRHLIEGVADLDVQLTIVGEGEKEAELRALAASLGVDDQVTFVGHVPHAKIHEYYEAADVFVLPSNNEGMSNTVLEAMAAGVPIVVTDTGGTKELVDGNGIVVPKQSATGIAQAIAHYQDNRELILEHGEVSRKIATKMSWSNVAEQYDNVYDRIVGEREEASAEKAPVSRR